MIRSIKIGNSALHLLLLYLVDVLVDSVLFKFTGNKLLHTQGDIPIDGWAFECRVYAEVNIKLRIYDMIANDTTLINSQLETNGVVSLLLFCYMKSYESKFGSVQDRNARQSLAFYLFLSF